jgi:hypothetical protein
VLFESDDRQNQRFHQAQYNSICILIGRGAHLVEYVEEVSAFSFCFSPQHPSPLPSYETITCAHPHRTAGTTGAVRGIRQNRLNAAVGLLLSVSHRLSARIARPPAHLFRLQGRTTNSPCEHSAGCYVSVTLFLSAGRIHQFRIERGRLGSQ